MKRLFIWTILVSVFLFPIIEVSASSIDCPDVNKLEQTSLEDKQEFLKALETIIPEMYGSDEDADKYGEWKIITATPFPKTVGVFRDDIYRRIAANYCGEDVSSKSWLARIYFPKWEGVSSSLSQGQLFLAKNEEQGWFVWFCYH
ncbi:hypothetical protein ACFQ3N_05205 [Virgibacillus byunsanensis]|uniref:Uncharacterized protein n=1 Tax=Virgibacillus byunsanensis TaxID=570945 RepID=A0ABW3LHC8_9BACI